MQESIQNLTVAGGWSAGSYTTNAPACELESLLMSISDDQHAQGNTREGIALERIARLVETHWADPVEHEQALTYAREDGQESGYDTGWEAGREDGKEQRDDLRDRIERLEREISDLRENAPAPQ